MRVESAEEALKLLLISFRTLEDVKVHPRLLSALIICKTKKK
jgi:hypothetical protein